MSGKLDGDEPLPSPALPPPPLAAPTTLLLLKTRSQPHDPYAAHLAAPQYRTHFLPVLTHVPRLDARAALVALLHTAPLPLAPYGGLVITSQRAVEVLTDAIEEAANSTKDPSSDAWRSSEKVVYVVGPATGNAVTRAVDRQFPRWRVLGRECGNGQALAAHIMEHYASPISSATVELPDAAARAIKRGALPEPAQASRTPLLFVAGETRRDTVPVTLMAVGLPAPRRVRVDELACYATADRAEFPAEFAAALATAQAQRAPGDPPVWVVVFSPAHCGSVLQALDWAGPARKGAGNVTYGERQEKGVRVASIGPTTATWLREQWGFEVDVCVETPSPDGVRSGIEVWTSIHS